jgi:L-seryl-tRNA(Ser) seleniumtransferase
MVNYGAPIPQGIALSGAEVVPLGTAALCEVHHLEAALRAGLAAAVYVVSHHTVREGELPLDLFIEICAGQGVPVIIDMASEYDLNGPVALGADAVIYSGHKFLSGPTSGIVAGRRRMIHRMVLQNRGIGRAMKIGKAGIVGAVAALEAWRRRDHAAARAREAAIVAHWLEALGDLPGVAAAPHDDWTGNPITRVELRLDPPRAGLFAWELAERLMEGDPRIALRDDHAEHQRLHLDPCNLTEVEAEAVATAIRAALAAARSVGDGCRTTWSAVKRRRSRALPEGDGP